MEINEISITKSDEVYFKNFSDKSKIRILNALFKYLNFENVDNLTPAENMLFLMLTKRAEERFMKAKTYKETLSEAGKRGAQTRWNKKNVENSEKTDELSTKNSHPIASIATLKNYSNNLRKLSKSINKYNIFSINAPASERAPERNEETRNSFKQYLTCESARFTPQINDLYNEVIDTIIEASEQSQTKAGLKFRQKVYDADSFSKLLFELNSVDQIIDALMRSKNDIKYRPFYILGAVINLAERAKQEHEKENRKQEQQKSSEKYFNFGGNK